MGWRVQNGLPQADAGGGAADRGGGGAARQVVDGLRAEVCGQQEQSNDPRNNQPKAPTIGRR